RAPAPCPPCCTRTRAPARRARRRSRGRREWTSCGAQTTPDLRPLARTGAVLAFGRVRPEGCGMSGVQRPGGPGGAEARFWTREEGGKILCRLCPRACRLGEGQRAFCFVRAVEGGRMVLTTYGRSSGFCVDPIEKKPLNHFYPGTSVLSFGTAGCNLGCKFCQNWDISRAREWD